jgi:transcriptional regulator with XRE-family HTH domain
MVIVIRKKQSFTTKRCEMPGKIGNRKMKPCQTELGRFVRERRLALSMGQIALGEMTGLKNQISIIEIGKRQYLNDDQLCRLAQALQCDEEELRLRMPVKPVAKPKTERGHFIRARREELGLSIQAFAQKMGITINQAKRLENERRECLQYAMAFKLAQVLELDLSALARFMGPRQKDATSPFGQLVRARRRELCMSPTALAKKLGISRQHVDNIEYGRSNLSRSDDPIQRLAKALELDVSVLMAVRTKGKRGGRKCAREYTPTSLGILIRKKRVEQSLSQKELADRASVCALTISHIETGRTLPRYDTLRKLGQALGIDLPGCVPSDVVEPLEKLPKETTHFRVPPKQRKDIERIKELSGPHTDKEVIRRALDLYLRLLEQREGGWLILQRKDGSDTDITHSF